jgi:hypothetical protein
VAGGQPHVVDVEGDDLADAQAGVVRQQRDDRVAGVGVFLDGAQPGAGYQPVERAEQTVGGARGVW